MMSGIETLFGDMPRPDRVFIPVSSCGLLDDTDLVMVHMRRERNDRATFVAAQLQNQPSFTKEEATLVMMSLCLAATRDCVKSFIPHAYL